MSEKHDYTEEQIIEWANRIAAQWKDTEDELYSHFLELLKAYRRLLRSFNRVTRISDGYQKSLMETNEYLNRAARRDALTGISNRRNMMDLLSNEVKRANRYDQTFSLLLLDIDHFKQVNDTYGHEVGDEVLISLARILSTGLRETDTPARWGGEEFLICLPHTPIEDAVRVAEKLRGAVAGSYVLCGEEEVRVTISAGAAQFETGTPVDHLIRAADEALYAAKDEGRNCVRTAG